MWLAAGLVTAALMVVAVSFAAKDDTVLVSRASGTPGAKGNGHSRAPRASDDARYVAFESLADNLGGGDADTTSDVFIRDRQTDTTTLMSRATGGAGAKGNGASTGAMISEDGLRVAFVTSATNLDPADPGALQDAYVRDRGNATTTLVSRADGPAGVHGNGSSGFAEISGNGRAVSFFSTSTNLDPDDADGTQDSYVRDIDAATTTLVSRATGAAGVKANAASHPRSISDDGRFVVIQSSATNLDPDDADAGTDVFVRDIVSATTTLVSRATGVAGVKGNGDSFVDSIAGNGRYVTFTSQATNLDPDDADTGRDTYVRDLLTSTTALVSRASGAGAPRGNGRVAGFLDRRRRADPFLHLVATNLDPADPDRNLGVFVRDLQSATTTALSRAIGPAGANANATSLNPPHQATGALVVFQSVATNLDADDVDALNDIFVRDVLGPPAPPAPPAPPPPPPPAADQDGDGIADSDDNCPVTRNADQADDDGDRIGNVCENNEASPGPVLTKIVVLTVQEGSVIVREPGDEPRLLRGGSGYRSERSSMLATEPSN